jgi:hypothetical protein
MTMASPFTKPNITECGTNRMDLPSRSTPAKHLSHERPGAKAAYRPTNNGTPQ